MLKQHKIDTSVFNIKPHKLCGQLPIVKVCESTSDNGYDSNSVYHRYIIICHDCIKKDFAKNNSSINGNMHFEGYYKNADFNEVKTLIDKWNIIQDEWYEKYKDEQSKDELYKVDIISEWNDAGYVVKYNSIYNLTLDNGVNSIIFPKQQSIGTYYSSALINKKLHDIIGKQLEELIKLKNRIKV